MVKYIYIFPYSWTTDTCPPRKTRFLSFPPPSSFTVLFISHLLLPCSPPFPLHHSVNRTRNELKLSTLTRFEIYHQPLITPNIYENDILRKLTQRRSVVVSFGFRWFLAIRSLRTWHRNPHQSPSENLL